jgi:peroxiredoxin
VGEPIPAFRLPDADGTEVALDDLAHTKVLLVNWSPRCGFCTRIAPELAELQPDLRSNGVDLVFLTLGTPEENAPLLQEHGLEPRVLFGDGQDVEVFAGVGTPSAYLVDPEGKASSALTVGADQVPVLARKAAGKG